MTLLFRLKVQSLCKRCKRGRSQSHAASAKLMISKASGGWVLECAFGGQTKAGQSPDSPPKSENRTGDGYEFRRSWKIDDTNAKNCRSRRTKFVPLALEEA
jgi:hypothetical protein